MDGRIHASSVIITGLLCLAIEFVRPVQTTSYVMAAEPTDKPKAKQEAGLIIVEGVQTDATLSIDLSPDGLQIVGGGFGKSPRIWETSSNKLIHQFETGAPSVRAVAFHPQGLTLVASTNNGLNSWELRSGKSLHNFQGSSGECRSLAFSRDGKLLAGSSSELIDGKRVSVIRVWNFETGDLLQRILNETSMGQNVAFSPDGRWLASPFFKIAKEPHSRPIKDSEREAGIRFWSTTTWTQSKTFTNERGTTYTVDFSPDGRRVASGGGYFANEADREVSKQMTGEVSIWNFETGQIQKKLMRDEKAGSVHPHRPTSRERFGGQHYGRVFQFPREQRVLSEVTMWDVESGNELWSVADAHAPDPQPPVFSPDGKYIYTRDSKAIRKLDVSNGEIIDIIAEAKPIAE